MDQLIEIERDVRERHGSWTFIILMMNRLYKQDSPSSFEKLPVVVSINSGQVTPGVARLSDRTLAERWRIALITFGVFFIVAAFFFFAAPFMNLVLVPVILFAGLIASVYIFANKQIVTGGEGTCPHCSRSLTFARGSARWPIEDTCLYCNTRVKIHPQKLSQEEVQRQAG